MTDRPSIDHYLMSIAHNAAARSTCSSRHSTGAVAAVEGRVVMTGYNGVPSKVPHCDDSGCVRHSDGKHAFLLHAEENLVAQSALLGVPLRGSTVYVTHMPCSHCAAMLSQAGVWRIVYDVCSLPTDEARVTIGLLKQTGVVLINLHAEVL